MTDFKAQLIQQQLIQSGSIDAAVIALADSQPSNVKCVYYRRGEWRRAVLKLIKEGKVKI